MLLGLDDTDGRAGGCTTHAAWSLVAALPEGVDLIGYPRFVRLNPNVPHKTRGNGAIALRLGEGRGAPRVVGHAAGRALAAYPEGDELSASVADHVLVTARDWIERHARRDDPRTHPGLVATHAPPAASFYEAAVARYVGRGEARTALEAAAGRAWTWGDGRGLVGATAAIAWPAEHGTYEWIGYRAPARWGTPRDLGPELAAELDAHHPSTFDNHDPVHGRVRMVPHTPCPVLAGVRGTDPGDLLRAAVRLGPERSVGGLVFATNQATDDHRRPTTADAVRPYANVSIVARVARRPWSLAGGHVFVRLEDTTGVIDAAAFEPTKGFRDAVRALAPGDVVRLHGGVHEDPSLVALERIDVLEADARVPTRAPDCPACGRRMRSRGRDEAYRCRRCPTRTVGRVPRSENTNRPRGAYEVPIHVRRHLARPLGLRRLVENPTAL